MRVEGEAGCQYRTTDRRKEGLIAESLEKSRKTRLALANHTLLRSKRPGLDALHLSMLEMRSYIMPIAWGQGSYSVQPSLSLLSSVGVEIL